MHHVRATHMMRHASCVCHTHDVIVVLPVSTKNMKPNELQLFFSVYNHYMRMLLGASMKMTTSLLSFRALATYSFK